jgi:acetyl esterase/lipase
MGSCSENKFDYYPPYPLHPSVKDKLDPTYVEFYNKHLIDKQQVHLQAVAASRKSGVLIPGGGPELKVGRKEDIVVKRRETKGPDIKCRVFIPEGEPPKEGWRSEQEGWPLMVYYHGGGWVLGNLDTENTVCSQLCVRSRCVVVSVDYR